MKKIVFGIVFILMIVLSGCDAQDQLKEYVSNEIAAGSGIKDDEDNQELQRNLQEGKVKDGVYSDDGKTVLEPKEPEEDNQQKNPIHITFSRNNHLNIKYYSDAAMKVAIDTSDYRVSPGAQIYAVVEKKNNINSDKYEFDRFRIFEYQDGTERVLLDESGSELPFVYQIPEAFEGTEIAIEPIGKYEKRILTFSSYYFDANNKKCDLFGKWNVNGQETEENSMEISPVVSYTVSYAFDADKYFYYSSTPAYFCEKDGHVVFPKVEPTEGIENFSIELHPYLTTSIRVDADGDISVTANDETFSLKKGKEKQVGHLKYGDRVIIKTQNDWDWEKDIDKKVLNISSEDKENHTYVFSVVEGNGDFIFEPSKYSYAHGKIEFSINNSVITEKTPIGTGRVINYRAIEAEDGYWLPSGGVTVEGQKETEEKISDIRFYPDKNVTVTLQQPVAGGKIVYTVNGKEIAGKAADIKCGTTIIMKLYPWNGWKCDSNEAAYIVEDLESQTVTINGLDVSQAFSEAPDHKPSLLVYVDTNFGKEVTFSIATSNGSTKDLHVKDGIFDKVTGWSKIYEAETGTEKNLSISAAGDATPLNKLVKITVEKNDINGKEYREIRYKESLPFQEELQIYKQEEIATSKTTYKTIKVSLELVDKLTYEAKIIQGGNVSLQVIDIAEPRELIPGEMIDKDRKVLLKISPDDGYYVLGNNNAESYTEELNYADFQKKADGIIKKHAIKALRIVTLQEDDPFGTVEYYLDKERVSGTIQVREEQTLVMKYVITDQKHKINKDMNPVFSWFDEKLGNSTETSVEISIKDLKNNAQISREDYIKVVEK